MSDLSSQGSKQGAFSCKWLDCTHIYVRLGDLVEHVKLAHCGLDQPWPKHYCEWEGCWRQTPFSNQNNMVYHMRAHTGERPFECRLCGTRFSVRSNYNAHARTVHAQPKLVPKVIHFDETTEPLPPNGNGHTAIVRNQHTKIRDEYWAAKNRAAMNPEQAPAVPSKAPKPLPAARATRPPASLSQSVPLPPSSPIKKRTKGRPRSVVSNQKSRKIVRQQPSSQPSSSKTTPVEPRHSVQKQLQEWRVLSRHLVSKLRFLEVAQADLERSQKFYLAFPSIPYFLKKANLHDHLSKEVANMQHKVVHVLAIFLDKLIPSLEARLAKLQRHIPPSIKKLTLDSESFLSLTTPPLSPERRLIYGTK